MRYSFGDIRCLRTLVILILLCTAAHFSHGQEMFGISNSNFSGNMGMGLNPSLFVGSPYHHEWNIISLDAFFDNDYIYVEDDAQLLRKLVRGKPVSSDDLKDYYDGEPKNGYSSVFVRGPSYIKNGEKFSWGFHTALRSVASASDFPVDILKFFKEDLDYTPQQNIDFNGGDYESVSLVWAELGGTIGKKIYEKRRMGDMDELNAAVTLKFLAGFESAFIKVNELDYRVPSGDVIAVNNLNGEYGHAVDDGESDGVDFEDHFKIRGIGGGVDLGMTYYKGKVPGAGDCNETAEIRKKYKYRIGVSVIDLGMINFNKETRTFGYDNESATFQGLDSIDFNTIFDIDSLISQTFYGDPRAARTGEKYKAFLPSALSVQFDYCVMPSVYVNATLVQPLGFGEYAPSRPAQISFTPRYEKRKFEIAMPLTMYRYEHAHLGLAVRYGVVVLGTDRLGSYTGLWDITGYDIFFGLKWNICDPNATKKDDCPAYLQ